jgi:hypothetical protein
MSEDQPKRKRTKKQQSQVTESRNKMKEKVVESKKAYKRKSKHPNEDED